MWLSPLEEWIICWTQRSTSEPYRPEFELWWPKSFVRGLPWRWLLPSFRLAQRWTSELRSRDFRHVRWTMTSPIWSIVSSWPPTLSYRRWTWTRSCMPTLTLDLWDISVVLVVMNKFNLWDALAKYVNSYLHVGVNFCWILYQALFGCMSTLIHICWSGMERNLV